MENFEIGDIVKSKFSGDRFLVLGVVNNLESLGHLRSYYQNDKNLSPENFIEVLNLDDYDRQPYPVIKSQMTLVKRENLPLEERVNMTTKKRREYEIKRESNALERQRASNAFERQRASNALERQRLENINERKRLYAPSVLERLWRERDKKISEEQKQIPKRLKLENSLVRAFRTEKNQLPINQIPMRFKLENSLARVFNPFSAGTKAPKTRKSRKARKTRKSRKNQRV